LMLSTETMQGTWQLRLKSEYIVSKRQPAVVSVSSLRAELRVLRLLTDFDLATVLIDTYSVGHDGVETYQSWLTPIENPSIVIGVCEEINSEVFE
jgi:hypothetical protein